MYSLAGKILGMSLHTITTIELSTLCHLRCKYCIQPLMTRERGIMSDEVFGRSLYWLDILCRRGTQAEVNLNGNGESTLDPQLPARVRKVKGIVGNRQVGLSSNAISLTEDLMFKLADAGIDYLDLSPHDAYAARKAASLIAKNKMPFRSLLNTGAILTPHNWAGQLDAEHTIDMHYTLPCAPLIEGRGYISREGNLSPCCYDFRDLGKFGSVFDADLLTREVKAYELCHQRTI
jgi:hypothetical protein